MIDTKLIALVRKAKSDLKALGRDARPSQVMAVKEKFAADALAIAKAATDGITDAEKIAAFDKLMAAEQKTLVEQLEAATNGKHYYEDDDTEHYVWEEVRQLVFGKEIFTATNEFEKLLP